MLVTNGFIIMRWRHFILLSFYLNKKKLNGTSGENKKTTVVSKTASFKEFYFSFVSGVGEKLARELEKISRENRFITL